MAIGDANNDIPMLKAAGFSAVMGSAKDDVKACGDVVVGDNEHDGVAEAIYKYVLKNRFDIKVIINNMVICRADINR